MKNMKATWITTILLLLFLLLYQLSQKGIL